MSEPIKEPVYVDCEFCGKTMTRSQPRYRSELIDGTYCTKKHMKAQENDEMRCEA